MLLLPAIVYCYGDIGEQRLHSDGEYSEANRRHGTQ